MRLSSEGVQKLYRSRTGSAGFSSCRASSQDVSCAARPLGSAESSRLREGENRGDRQVQQASGPGDGVPVPGQAAVGGGAIDVAPQALEVGVLEQAAATTFLVQGVDRLSRGLGREGLVAAGGGAVGGAD